MKQNAALASVAPKNWSRAREVAAVVAHYRSLSSPTVKDVDAAAAKLNIKRRAFYNILQRSKNPLPKARRKPRLASANARQSNRTLVKKRRELKAQALIEMPDNERVAVDHAGLELAIETSEGKVPAYLSVVLDRANGAILGHSLGLEQPSPISTIAALLDWSEQSSTSSFAIVPAITMHSETGRPWASVRRILRRAGVETTGRHMQQLSKGIFLFERMEQIGRIPLRPRLNHERLSARVAGLLAVSMDDARETVAEAIAIWNEGRPIAKPFGLPEACSLSLANNGR